MKRLLILLLIATGLFAQSESGGYYIPSKWKLSGTTISPSLSTWSVGLPVTTATSLALGGATIGTNALAVNGNIYGSGTATFASTYNISSGTKLAIVDFADISNTATSGGAFGQFMRYASTASANSDAFRGIDLAPTLNKGAYTSLDYKGIYLRNPSVTGAGTITDAYGFYIETFDIGTNNYAIYTNGASPSYFGGNVGIATINPLATFHDNGTAMFGAGAGASLTDSSLVVNYSTGSPVLNWYGTDGDTWNIGINTSDGATFNGATTYNFDNVVINNAPVTLKGYTVATLPAGTVGMTAYVTDATAPTYLGALTGGGAVVTPVFYNGTAWVSY